ncbi:MAG: anthranilate phosphoribosyltransferase [Eubacteriales bacterium]
MMIRESISLLAEGKNLDYDSALAVMNEIMTGEATPSQIAGFLTALHIKGETVEEITAFANGMRAVATPFDRGGDTLEIVGTGGDKAGTVNLSTMAALVSAAAGCRVTKHGNRAASSKCGTADSLEALGAVLTLEPRQSRELLDQIGFAFLFAQKYHPAMRFVAAPRKELGIPTVFNILGPLANPAKANIQLMGVYSESLVEPLAHVLSNLGVERGMVVFGTDVMDEISPSAPTKVCEFSNGKFESYLMIPEQYGFTRGKKSDLVGGLPEENAGKIRRILGGTVETDADRVITDAVLLNAGAAIHLYKQVSVEEGIAQARAAIESGRAKATMEGYVSLSQKLAK